jgi:hypothetical protein
MQHDEALLRFIRDYLLPSRLHFAADPVRRHPFTQSTITVYEIEPHVLEEDVKGLIDLTDINIYPSSPLTQV